MFITFEGIDGSGKTTQAKMLADALAGMGYDVVLTREPGGTDVGEAIRGILTNHHSLTVRAQVLLFNAARAQLVETVIRPALEAGKVVICDRFYDSTFAYQGYGCGEDMFQLDEIIRYAVGEIAPDLTVLLDIDSMEAIRRIEKRDNPPGTASISLHFLNDVRDGFVDMCGDSVSPWVQVYGAQPIADIHQCVLDAVMPRLEEGRE